MRAAILIAAIIAMALVTVWVAGTPVKSNNCWVLPQYTDNPGVKAQDQVVVKCSQVNSKVGWKTQTQCEQAVVSRAAKNADGTPQLLFGQHLLDMGHSTARRSRSISFVPSAVCAGLLRDQELDPIAIAIRDEVMRENVERLLKDYLNR